MAIDRELYSALKTANRRIQRLQKSQNVIYKKTVQKQMETLFDKAQQLTGVISETLTIGHLDPGDRDKYLNIVNRFINSPLSTIRGQKALRERNKQAFLEVYGTDETGAEIEVSDASFDTMMDFMESDEWKQFSEKYMTYSNVISDMLAHPLSYDRGIAAITELVKATPDNMPMAPAKEPGQKPRAVIGRSGDIDVAAFVDWWRDYK